MSVLSAILQHSKAEQALKPATALPQASAAAGTTSSSASSSAASAASSTISANDFLTLLVTEMQNQDPTAQTDPNEYINQLVQVNSLEQLIDINQTLGSAFTSPTSSTTSSGSSAQPGLASKGSSSLAASIPQPTAGGSLSSLPSDLPSHASASKTSATPHAAGNFTIPKRRPQHCVWLTH
jgi:flagellar basal-body rod modification protein FlgD